MMATVLPITKRKSFKCTDTGNAERLVAAFGDSIRYCWGRGWLHWCGTHWTEDRSGRLMSMAKQTVRDIYVEAREADTEDERKRLASHAIKSESKKARVAMIDLAASEPGIPILPEQLDRDPMLLNTPTATIDLRTGVPREHDPKDLITKITGARYQHDARSELFERVVSEACGGDEATIQYFQRAAGYSITGSTTEEKVFVVIGPGASGKSTILNSIKNALGDYAKTADFDTFIARKDTGTPRNDVARLAGTRMVLAIEVDAGKRLAPALLKTLTGGDVVSARFLFKESFEFRPECTVWLAANDAPRAPHDDDAIWRRLERIPFEHVVPVEKRDLNLKDKLAQEGSGILTWLIEGALFWQAKGLGTAPAITAATAAYRSDQDPLREFLVDCCEIKSGALCSRKALRDEYERWHAEAGGRQLLSGKDFTARIRKLDGVSESRAHGARLWLGISTFRVTASPGVT